MPTFRSALFNLNRQVVVKMKQCSETSAYKFQTPGSYPEESIQHSEQIESLKPFSIYLQLNYTNLEGTR